MKIINYNMIKKLGISAGQCYEWVDFAMKNRERFQMQSKMRISLNKTNYFNIMPCIIEEDNVMGLKVVTRNQERREKQDLNLDSQILLYSYNLCEPLALMDANYITTMRTAAVAVHTLLHTTQKYDCIAMIGLGNIGTIIGDILFEKIEGKNLVVKLYKYKDHAERFINRFSKYNNIKFVTVEDYDDLMRDSDVIISSVTYIEDDFCAADIYKKGCTIIPVHVRGFMDCDLNFEHIITSDLKSIEKFKYYSRFKKLSLLDDVIFQPSKIRTNQDDRIIIYNLGLALNDIYFAAKIYGMMDLENIKEIQLKPEQFFYS